MESVRRYMPVIAGTTGIISWMIALKRGFMSLKQFMVAISRQKTTMRR